MLKFTKFSFSILSILFATQVSARHLGFIKNYSLYVINDIDKGNSQARNIQSSVLDFRMRGDVGFVKHTNGVWKFCNDVRVQYCVPQRIDVSISSIATDTERVVYLKNSQLWTRTYVAGGDLGPEVKIDSNVMDFDLEKGVLVYRKNQVTLYRVTDFTRGLSERVIYPVGAYRLAD